MGRVQYQGTNIPLALQPPYIFCEHHKDPGLVPPSPQLCRVCSGPQNAGTQKCRLCWIPKRITVGLPRRERGAPTLGGDRTQQRQAFPTSVELVRAFTFPPEILSSSNSCGFSSELLLCVPISILSRKQKHCFFLLPVVPFLWPLGSRF